VSDTNIEWAHKVWNPMRGCRRVSPGCEACYAERQAIRHAGPGGSYDGLATSTAKGPRWTGKVIFAEDKLGEPLRWRAPKDGSRLRVFVDSMSDLFYDGFTDEQIAAVFGVMAACPQHDFLVLTKRPERAEKWFAWVNLGPNHPREIIGALAQNRIGGPLLGGPDVPGGRWPLPNVWLGVSVENQEYADARIPVLLRIRAAVRFVSAKPLLGPVDFTDITLPDELAASARLSRAGCNSLVTQDDAHVYNVHPKIDWVIVGGESGQRARPCHVRWVRSIVEQCRDANVPAFVKQLGAHVAHNGIQGGDIPVWPDRRAELDTGNGYFRRFLIDNKGGDPAEWPEDIRVRKFPAVPPCP